MLYKLENLQWLKDNLIRVWLRPETKEYLAFQAGQYLEILYPDSSFQPFSIANAPNVEHTLELHIRCLATDYATIDFLQNLQQTQQVTLRGPEGKAYYRPQPTTPTLLLAGGTGFAYIKAIVEQAIVHHDLRHWHLFWSVKTPQDFYLTELISQWQQALKHFQFTPMVTKPVGDWEGKTGYIQQVVVEEYPALSNIQIYAGGPAAMIQNSYQLFLLHGLQKELIYSDML